MEFLIFLIVVIVVIILIALFVFIFNFIDTKNRVIELKEGITLLKSNIRIKKAKYLQVVKKSLNVNDVASLSANTMYKDSYGILRDINGNAIFGTSATLVAKLAMDYEDAQLQLNRLISTYNSFISTFPRSIFCSKYKKEIYIDNDRLDLSMLLAENIDSEEI